MKKSIVVSLVVAAVVVFALGSFGTVSAYSGAPVTEDSAVEFGFGGRGGRMGGGSTGVLSTFMHDVMLQTFSTELGISVEDLQARLDAGETMSSIALETGMTLEEYQALMQQVRDAALDQAVAEGLLTQTQADTMSQMGNRTSNGTGSYGGMNPDRAPRGMGTGTGTCIVQ